MNVTINGESRDIPAGTTVEQLVGQLTAAPSGVAAAVNGAVVPRTAWGSTALTEDDEVEVLTAVQGG